MVFCCEEKYGSVAKIVYVGDKPKGLIQYQLRIEEKVIEILFVYVPHRSFQQLGIATKLFQSLKEDANTFSPLFNDSLPRGFIATAFDVPGYFPLRKLYPKLGFFQISKENTDLFYYPLEKGWRYIRSEQEYQSLETDGERALLFYDPSCPFCIYFNDLARVTLRKIAPNLEVQEINIFFQQEEVAKRGGKVPFCIVNCTPIHSFVLDKEHFEEEVRKALQS